MPTYWYIEDIQMFLLNYVFYFTSEVDNIYISWVAKLRHSWNINIVHFTREIKDIFNKKKTNTFVFSFDYL